MLRSINKRQLFEWIAYAELEPFGEDRADWRAALVASMVHNVAVDRKHQKKVQDFLLKFGDQEPRKPKTWQEMKAKLLGPVATAWAAKAKDT